MKKYLIQLCFAALTATFLVSCEGEIGSDEPLDYNTGINVVTFGTASTSTQVVSDGEVKIYNAKVQLMGPTVENVTQDITVNVSIDKDASTAVEGTHYMPLEVTSVTLTKENNYLSVIPIKIITSGITPPLTDTPQIVLDIDNIAGGGSNVVLSGNQQTVTIDIEYLCFSNLTGVYLINYSSGAQPHTVTEVSSGVYSCDFFPGWPTDPTTAFTFKDVCGQLTMIDWGYSNVISGTGHVDPGTGDIIWDDVTVEGVSGYENLSWVMVKQ